MTAASKPNPGTRPQMTVDPDQQRALRVRALADMFGAAPDDLERSSILDIASYDLALDLTHGPETLWSRTEVSFRCRKPGAATFADLHAVRIGHARLNGADLDPAVTFRGGRLGLPRLDNENLLIVEAEFAYASGPEDMCHVTDARDGSVFVWGRSSAQGASFDRPDLRAIFTVSVDAPGQQN